MRNLKEGVSFARVFVRFGVAIGIVLPALCFAQDLCAPLDPVFPSRFVYSVRQEGYVEYRVEFPSAYRSPYPANNTVHAWWLVPTKRTGRAPTVVLLHSLGVRRPELEMGLARELARNGVAVFLMTLPYHMQRTPPGYGSGDLILAGDIALLREAGIQATWDVRRAVDWLQRQPEVDPDRIALVGISLGAILGATALASEPRLHSAVLILGGADLAHVLWDSILAIRARARLRREGYTLERLREELAPIEPLNLLTPEHGEKTFVIGARFDIVVPTEDTEKLIRALGNPKVLWLNTGHFGGGLVQRPLFRLVRQHLQARFEGRNPDGNLSVLAPRCASARFIARDATFGSRSANRLLALRRARHAVRVGRADPARRLAVCGRAAAIGLLRRRGNHPQTRLWRSVLALRAVGAFSNNESNSGYNTGVGDQP
jgi:acetyl esterase/lipase